MKAAILVLAACGTGTTYRTTRIAPPGHTEWLFGAQAAGVSTTGMDEGGSTMDKAAPLPELAVGARHALDERFEVQLSGTLLPTPIGQTGSVELGGKARLFEHGRWSLAAGTGMGYRLVQIGGAKIEDVYVSAPLIGGIDLGRHQLVVSIDGGFHRTYSSGANPVNIPFIGQSLGFRWQLTRSFALLPEVGSAWTPTSNAFTERSRLFNVGIAALWTR